MLTMIASLSLITELNQGIQRVLQIQTYKTIIANGYDEIKKGLQTSFLCG